jgi:hypothetical protein
MLEMPRLTTLDRRLPANAPAASEESSGQEAQKPDRHELL